MIKNFCERIAKISISYFLIVVVVLSLLPFSAFVATAEPTATLDGTFESYTLNESPLGWSMVSFEGAGGTGEYYSDPNLYADNYLLTVVSKNSSGGKALSLAANYGANKTTFGYVAAQSPEIVVDGGKEYFFDYTVKTIVESNEKYFYGGRIFIVEYDANGNKINRVKIGSDLSANTDWTSYTVPYTTKSNTAKIKIDFYLGGAKDSNFGAKFLIDDVSFETLSEDKLLNGGFEETKSNGDLYSWYLRPCTNVNGDTDASEFVTNHELKIVSGYHGNAAQITKKGAGYVTLTSNMMKVENDSTYIVDYSLKITNCNLETFLGARLEIAEFDANKNLVKRTRMHTAVQEVTDWKEFSFSYTPGEEVKYFRLELYCGDHNKTKTFTVLFDDVSVTKFSRTNSNNIIENSGFEEVYNNTFFDWQFTNVAGTKYSSTFDGYNGTKGLLIQRKGEKNGYGMLTSNLFDVTPGQEIKVTYMVRFDNFKGSEYSYYSLLYAIFYDKDGKEIVGDRINEADYHPHSVDWTRRQSYHTVPENAVKCKIGIRVNGSTYDCWIDDVKVTYLNSKEDGFGFNKNDANGEIYGWTVSNPAKAKLDTSIYREGTGSLFISQFVDQIKTYVYSDTLIPVEVGVKYELTAWIKSYDCDISADGIILNAYAYDKDEKFLGTGRIITGRVMTLNNDSNPSNWRQVICGVVGTEQIAYVRPVIEIPYGKANLWIDDVECTAYSLNNEFYEDFNAVRNDGQVDGWNQIVEDGAPVFETYNSIASITAEDDDDIGTISARWDTRMEYKSMKFAMNYATKGDTEAKVTIKFYNFNDQEIVADRIEKEFDSTAGEYMEAAFDFVLMTAKFMRIEISNTEDGVLLIDDVVIVSVDEEKDEDEITWRGYWVWHNEDYRDSINGTPRYFRYHFTLTDIPVSSFLQITADDYLRVWINGIEYYDEAMNLRYDEISVFDTIHESLKVGDNVIAVEVGNYNVNAGLIFDGFAEYESGERVDFYSTTHIVSTKVKEEGWLDTEFDDSDWTQSIFVDYNAGGTWPEDLIYDKTPFIKDKFSVVDYTLTEYLLAGEDAFLTMTIIPEIDFKKDVELKGNLWIKNTANQVMTVDMNLISGPKMSEWRKGEEITVTFTFNIPDFIASGKYIIQLETNQVVITNDEIINNRFIKTINLVNNTIGEEMDAQLVNQNGTIAVSINGEIRPFNMMKKPHTILANESSSVQYMHDAGICITKISTMIGYNSRTDHIAKSWNGIDDYDWSELDNMIYTELSIHPDTYLMATLYLGVREWWVEQNPDQCVVDSNGDIHDVSFFSESAYEAGIKANLDMLEHMMAQPYWNRIISFNLVGGEDTEFMWPGGGPTYTIDYSEPAVSYFRKWLTSKYGTDQELKKAWNDNSVSLATAVPPSFDEHQNSVYDSIYDPKVNAAARDFAECMEDREIEIVKGFYAAVTEKINDSRFLGSYFGYLYTRAFYNDAIRTMHTKIDEFLDDPNLDFLCAPGTYTERLDGMAAATNQMIDGVLRKGKAVLIEDDYRTAAYINDAKNFYSRDSVGTTYNINDTLSAFIKNQAICLTQGASLWYSNIEAIMYEREQFSRVIEVLHGERYIDLSREKSYTGEVCYIMDEDGYENWPIDESIYEPTYEMLFEQKYDLARAGILVDYYSMSDLVDGIVPDYKVYVMINTIEIDAEEKAAIDKYLKNNGKIVLWQWLAGASDRTKISEQNMSEVIGMDVKFNTSELVLKTIIENKEHWLIDGVEGTTIGSGLGGRKTSPIATVTDKDANVIKLGHLYDGENYSSLAVMENDDWTSIFSSVPGYNVKMIKNVLEKAGVHMYSDNLNDVIYANSNYVAINAAYGGEKTIKLDGTYAVYDVVSQTTYSTSTNVINFTMEDNQTKVFRLMPVNTNIIYVNTMYQGTLEGEAYNEVTTGDDFSAKVVADDGYVIAQIITDTERKTINRSSYTIEFDDVDNSHYVRVIFAPEGSVEGGENNLLTFVLIGVGVLVIAAAAVFILLFLKKKKQTVDAD